MHDFVRLKDRSLKGLALQYIHHKQLRVEDKRQYLVNFNLFRFRVAFLYLQ